MHVPQCILRLQSGCFHHAGSRARDSSCCWACTKATVVIQRGCIFGQRPGLGFAKPRDSLRLSPRLAVIMARLFRAIVEFGLVAIARRQSRLRNGRVAHLLFQNSYWIRLHQRSRSRCSTDMPVEAPSWHSAQNQHQRLICHPQPYLLRCQVQSMGLLRARIMAAPDSAMPPRQTSCCSASPATTSHRFCH